MRMRDRWEEGFLATRSGFTDFDSSNILTDSEHASASRVVSIARVPDVPGDHRTVRNSVYARSEDRALRVRYNCCCYGVAVLLAL